MGALKMPNATRKTVRDVEARSERLATESVLSDDAPARLHRCFQILTEPLSRDAVGAQSLADVINRIGRGEVQPADVSDEIIGIYWGRIIPPYIAD